jgi:hypothetical protein
MTKRIMSEAEQRRRQKLQSQIGRTTSTMGLSALGVTGAAALAARKGPAGEKTLGMIRKIPGLKKTTPEKMERTAIKSGIVSGGIGGVGGFNQASIYSAESRRRKQATPVKKDLGMEMGYYGEEGTPLTHEEIEFEIEKAWTPSASNFDSERSRKKRGDAYSAGALVTGGAGAAYGGHHGIQAVRHGRKIKSEQMAPTVHVPDRPHEPEVKHVPFKPGKPAQDYQKRVGRKGDPGYVPHRPKRDAIPEQAEIPGKAEVKARAAHLRPDAKGITRAIRTEHLSPALKHGGKAAVGAAVLGGSVAAGMHLKRKKNSSWQSYAKRDDVSKLFGKKGKPGFRKIGNVSDQDAAQLMAMQGKYGKGKVSKSAFGVDHEVSKASILGQGSRLAHEAGAGGIAAAKLGEGMGPARHPSSFAYGAHRAQAKKLGKLASRHYAANGDVQGYGAQYHANTGWNQRVQSAQNLPASKPAPVGMRGPITSRVKTKKMKANEQAFL